MKRPPARISSSHSSREELCDFPPPPGVAEIGQVEPIITGLLKPGEPGFEEGRQGARSRRTISGTKIKEGTAPLDVKIHQVIEIGSLWGAAGGSEASELNQ